MILRILLKCVLIPIFAAIVLLKWVMAFLSSLSTGLFCVLAAALAIMSALTYLMGLAEGRESLMMLAGSFVCFVIPVLSELAVTGMQRLQETVGDCIRN